MERESIEQLTKNEHIAFQRYLKGEKPAWSTGIDGGMTAGYGRLDQFGFWEYPLPVKGWFIDIEEIERITREKEMTNIITLGFIYSFNVPIQDYDCTMVMSRVCVYALGYTQALENLQKCGFGTDEVKFMGEAK